MCAMGVGWTHNIKRVRWKNNFSFLLPRRRYLKGESKVQKGGQYQAPEKRRMWERDDGLTSSSGIPMSVSCPAAVPAGPSLAGNLPLFLLSPFKAATSLPDRITGFEIAPKNLFEGEGDGVDFGSPV